MRLFCFIALCLAAFSLRAELVHFPVAEQPHLFAEKLTQEFEYPVVAGAVQLQAESDEFYTSGYHAEESIVFTGKRTSLMYDYAPHLSLEFILNRVYRSLLQQGYFLEYECYSQECGEASAMQVFTDDLMEAGEDRYGYKLFSRNLRNDDMISVYAVLIDSSVRVLFDIYSDSNDDFYINLNSRQAAKEFAGMTLYFKIGSSVVEDRFAQLATDFIEKILAGDPDARFLVNGHSDRSGAEVKNRLLSSQRVNRVGHLFSLRNTDRLCGSKSFGSSAPYFYSAVRHNYIVVAESAKNCTN